MPLIVPFELFSDSPGGSDPEMIENVSDPDPPVTDMLAEYAVPT